MFRSLPRQRPLVLVLLKRFCLVVLGAYLVIGLVSAYRAWYQVHSVNLKLQGFGSVYVPHDPRAKSVSGVAAGSVFEADLVSYARTHIDVGWSWFRAKTQKRWRSELWPATNGLSGIRALGNVRSKPH